MRIPAHFTIISPTPNTSLSAQLDETERLLAAWLADNGLRGNQLIQARFYLTDAANSLSLLETHSLYNATCAHCARSWIEQPLLDGTKVAVQVWALETEGLTRWRQGDYSLGIEVAGERLLFESFRFGEDDVRGLDADAQTRLAFRRHVRTLAEYELTLKDHCLRTWFFVRDIDHHYGGVVSGRNAIFAHEGLTADDHFIASTGIGGYTDNTQTIVAADFLSADTGANDANIRYLKALDYLNPTAEYGVAFERGTAITLWGTRYRFISGTASIDCHGRCVHRGDVVKQADRLFTNISKLLEDDGATLADMAYYIVYLRDVADAATISRYMAERYPHTPYLITEARVCRPEWLIEVEGIATD